MLIIIGLICYVLGFVFGWMGKTIVVNNSYNSADNKAKEQIDYLENNY